MTFGEFIKARRLALGLSLRELCIQHSKDPSNWSKIERGVIPAPVDPAILEEYARILKIEDNTHDWHTLYDLAASEHGRIPHYILSNEELVRKLPLFFRTIGAQKPTEAELDKLLELIRSNG